MPKKIGFVTNQIYQFLALTEDHFRFRKLFKAGTSDYSEQKYGGCCVEPCPDMAAIHCDLFLKESIVALVTLVPSLVVPTRTCPCLLCRRSFCE